MFDRCNTLVCSKTRNFGDIERIIKCRLDNLQWVLYRASHIILDYLQALTPKQHIKLEKLRMSSKNIFILA